MKGSSVIHEVEIEVMGAPFQVQIYGRESGGYFAFTRFSDCDAIINDGISIDEALQRQTLSLPIAVECRPGRIHTANSHR